MSEARHVQSKIGFQIDRISNFSDGVFAIAITLLVIELKIPALLNANDRVLWASVSKMGWKFAGFLISFSIVGYYWSVHHRIFGYVNHYTSRLLWLNLFFLFSVALLPFTSGLLGEYASDLDMYLPYGIYVLNICLTAIMNVWLWIYVSDPKKKLLTHTISRARIRLGIDFALVVPIVFIISFFISFLSPVVGRILPFFLPLILRYGLEGISRRATFDESRTPANAEPSQTSTTSITEQ